MNLLNGGKIDMKKTNYFSHDSNARNDDKILAVRMKFGAEGYGIYFMLLERLREDSKYMSIRDYNMIAFDFRTSVDKIKSIVEDFGLFIFTEDEKYFYSENFNERMSVKDEKTEKRSIAGRKGMAIRYAKKQQNDNNVITKLDNLDNNVITNEEKNLTSKVKESKVKKSKEKVTHIKKSEDFFENFDEVEVEEIPTLETEKEIPLQKSSEKKVSPIEDIFLNNLSKFQNDYPNTKRFQEICMFNYKPEEFMLKLFDEFIEDNRNSREHATKEDYAYFYQSVDKHFFYWAKAKVSKPTTQTKREQQSEIYKAINEGKSITEILGV